MPVTLTDLERKLAAPAPPPALLEGRRAAVAMLLREGGDGLEVLLMKRREHPGDRWSGHISLPGGKEQPGDADLVATATRETFEELGVDLAATARLIGRLPSVRATAQGKLLPMTITPFVFAAVVEAAIAPGDEAESAFWLPLGAAAAGALDAVYPYWLGPIPLSLPSWRFQGHVVWGLTYKMLRQLLDLGAG